MRPTRVRVGARLDRAGQAVLIGFPNEGSAHMADDKMLREMTSDPKFRKVLVTDGKTAVGQAIVRALVKAGADIVWVGHAEPWKKLGGLDDIAALPQVDAGAARPHQRARRDRAGRRSRRQGRHRDQQRRGAPHLRHRCAPRHRHRQGRNGHQLLRPAAARAGVRPGAQGPLGRRRDRRDGLGQPAVDLRAQQLSAARHLQRVQGRGPVAGAVPARRDAARRHSRDQRVSRGRSTTSGTSTCRRPSWRPPRWPTRSSRRCATASRTSTPATWRRSGSSAGATTRRCSSANWRRSGW